MLRFFGLFLLLLAPATARAAARDDIQPEAKELIARVLSVREDPAFKARARLTVQPAKSVLPSVVYQLSIKGRREKNGMTFLYQLSWPKERRGEAWVVRRTDGVPLEGFHFLPPRRVVPLQARDLAAGWLGSPLALGDLAEDFWRWPSQKITGSENVAGRSCRVLESRPAVGPAAARFVRTAVDTARSVPLRIQKLDAEGRVLLTLTAGKVRKVGERQWVATQIQITGEAAAPQSLLELTRGERNAKVDPAEFTPEGLQRLFLRQSPVGSGKTGPVER
jgi:hypothetical protein